MIDFSRIDKEEKEHLLSMLARQGIDFSSSGNRGEDKEYQFQIRVKKEKKKFKNSKNTKNFLKENMKNLGRIEAKVKVKKAQEEALRSIEAIKKKKLKISIERQIKHSKKSKKRNEVQDSNIEQIMAKMFESYRTEFRSRNSDLMSVERFSELLELGDCKYDDEMIKLKKFDQNYQDFYSDENRSIGFRDLKISQFEHKSVPKKNFDNGTFGEPINENYCEFKFQNSDYNEEEFSEEDQQE